MQDPVDCLIELPKRFPHVRRWCIAFSGGLDSQVLLSAAVRVLPLSSLRVIHVNHQLQDAADAWELQCRTTAEQLGVEFQVCKVEPYNTSEAAAREARYAAFSGVLQSGDALLMAHHADDQSETLLFRLCRGTGVSGLLGMHEVRSFSEALLVRPFIKLPRKALHEWAIQQTLMWIDDPSNQSVHYDRNFLRLEILPRLAQRWPKIIRRLSETASHMGEAQSILNEVAQGDLEKCQEQPEILNIPVLKSFTAARINNLLRFWLAGWNIQLNEMQLAQLKLQFLQRGDNPERELTLGQNWLLRTYRQRLFLCQVARLRDVDRLSVQRQIELSFGCLELPESILQVSDYIGFCADYGNHKIKLPGRHGRRSFSQLFQQAGVPPWLRNDWPVVCDSEGVLLLPGICCAERCSKKIDSMGRWQPFGLSGEPFFVSLQYHLDPS